MNDTFMKERPVLPLLLSMGLPMALSMLVNSLYNIVDSFFVAQISEDAMTALSLVFPIQNFINAVGIGFGVGINAVISLHLGAGQRDEADRAASQGLALSLVHGVVLTVGGIALMPAFLGMFTTSQAVIGLGTRYSNVAFSFTVMIMLGLVFEKLFQSVGAMKTTMASMLCGCVANILLDPVLIFGLGPFPALGIEGAALATGIGQTLTLAVYLAVYFLRPIQVRIRRKYLRPRGNMAKRLYAIGIPATLNLALPSLLVSALNAILAAYSQVYILVLGIYYKLQTFLYLPANGIVQGMRPIIGYNYGAGEHKRVSQIYHTVLCLCGGIMLAGTVICLLLPSQLMGLFTQTPETIQVGAQALRIISGGFLVSAVSVASCGALEGVGKGTPSLVISLCRYLVVIVPAAFLLSRAFGPVGVWHAFWVEVTPEGAAAGDYEIQLQLLHADTGEVLSQASACVRILPGFLPEQTLRRTSWFHSDCLAQYYRVPVFSAEHWQLIERFMAVAGRRGHNMRNTRGLLYGCGRAPGHQYDSAPAVHPAAGYRRGRRAPHGAAGGRAPKPGGLAV